MSDYGLPVLYALFVWWFSTGAIIYLDGLPQRTFRWSMLGATLVFAASIYGLWVTSADGSVAGAYIAFTCGLLAWGWQEISFYMGFVTGPRKDVCPEDCRGWRHFVHAIQTSLYHELAIIASAAVVVWVTWGGENQIGMWTFMVLWWMHQSAKLNVFLGVRNLNEDFLPDHLEFLKGFLTKKPMNLLFPVSVTVSTVIAVALVEEAIAPGATAFEVAGFTFLATLMALAILEHWFLVLPLPSAALWQWGLRSRKPGKPFEVEIASGFLGAGKTTFLRRHLAGIAPDIRTIALVNDFSELGVDASLLRGRGAEVVELPNGCICCSLRKDLGVQLKEIVAKWTPQRVVIEPSGVADVAALLRSLEEPGIAPLVKSRRLFAVVDACAFMRDYARMPGYFEAQAALDPTFVVNKTDLVSPDVLATVANTLRALNPQARIVTARFGQVTDEALPVRPTSQAAGKESREPRWEGHASHGPGHAGDMGDLQSWSTPLSGHFDPNGLRSLLDAVVGGAFGDVERIKGIAEGQGGWIHFDVAGGLSHMAAFAPGDREEPRVIAIGRDLDALKLRAAFEACAAMPGGTTS